MSVTDKIFRLLKSQGKTQKELADFLRTGASTIAGWKQDNRNPSVNLIMPICDFFGVTPEFLLREDEENNAPPITKDDEFVLMAKGYGETEIITLSEEDYRLAMSLFERLRHENDVGRRRSKKRKK